MKDPTLKREDIKTSIMLPIAKEDRTIGVVATGLGSIILGVGPSSFR